MSLSYFNKMYFNNIYFDAMEHFSFKCFWIFEYKYDT